jgi:hypothetical protein
MFDVLASHFADCLIKLLTGNFTGLNEALYFFPIKQLKLFYLPETSSTSTTLYTLTFFMCRYDVILPKDVLERFSGDKESICEAIMGAAQFSPEVWRIGKTKVFMKESDMVNHKTVSYH